MVVKCKLASHRLIVRSQGRLRRQSQKARISGSVAYIRKQVLAENDIQTVSPQALGSPQGGHLVNVPRTRLMAQTYFVLSRTLGMLGP